MLFRSGALPTVMMARGATVSIAGMALLPFTAGQKVPNNTLLQHSRI